MSQYIAGQVKTGLIVSSYTICDPPSRNTCLQLITNGWTIVFQQPDMGHPITDHSLLGVELIDSPSPTLRAPFRRLNGPLKFWLYRRNAARLIKRLRPKLVVAITLYDLASLPWPPEKYGYNLVCSILDVPVFEDSGKYDRVLVQRAWERIGRADVVWASDRYKAELAQSLGQLSKTPIVCHNAPNTDYLPEPTWPRDGWLRAQLRRQGAKLGENGGCIVVRAGAVGEHGGIEETLAALGDLPQDVVFLMMGRPYPEYKKRIEALIAEHRLTRRAILWDRPSDETWKRTLQGADLGHMIHGPFPAGKWQRLYENNSSMSNNRLFQYFAAGLPVLAYDDPRMNDIYAEVPAFRTSRLANLAEDIRKHVGELAADPNERQRLGRIGWTAYRNKYNWPVQFASVLAVISNIVGAQN